MASSWLAALLCAGGCIACDRCDDGSGSAAEGASAEWNVMTRRREGPAEGPDGPPENTSLRPPRPDSLEVDGGLYARYRMHLDEGRLHAGQGEPQQAVEAFARATALVPDDARALSELGLAALSMGDLDSAAEASSAALRWTAAPARRAAILETLGRIAEARQRPEEARRFYRRSLVLQEAATVRRRLLEADPAALDEGRVEGWLSSLGPEVFAEPVASTAALCGDGSTGGPCAAEVILPEGVARVSRTTEGETCHRIALKVGAGWSTLPIETCEGEGASPGNRSSTRLTATWILPRVVRLEIRTTDEIMDFCDAAAWESEVTYLCGEQRGRPVCWGVVSTALRGSTVRGGGRIAWLREEAVSAGDRADCDLAQAERPARGAPAEPPLERVLRVVAAGEHVTFAGPADSAPRRLLGSHRIHALPCLLASPPSFFSCDAGGD